MTARAAAITGTGFAETACQVAVQNTYNTTGTVTRSRIAVLSPTAIKALFYGTAGADTYAGWHEMKSLLKHQIEMQACGIRRDSLYDWMMSSNRPGMGQLINIQRVSRGPSLIAPFITGRQQSFWNVDHWVTLSNIAGSAYSAPGDGVGTNAGPGLPSTPANGNRVVTVASSFGGTMVLHPDYFLPRKRVHIMSRGAGGAFQITQFKIVQAGRNTDTTLDVELALDQPLTSGGAGEAVTSLATGVTAQFGLLFLGINNVQDVESWAYNMHNVNLTKMVPFWYQTRRTARTVDSAYTEFLAKMMEDNEWYRIFADTPMAERNRQDEAQDRNQWMHAAFFGERISGYQNLEKWGQLEQVKSLTGAGVDPGTGDQFQAFRANMIGILPQLADCGRWTDVAGGDFPINTFLENDIYNIVRARRSQNRPATEIDIYTDESTADEFMTAYIAYSKAKTGDIVRINVESGFTEWGFPFRRLKLYKPSGVYVNLITADFFNDLATAASYNAYGYGSAPFGVGAGGLGRFLMVLDMGQGGTIYPAVLNSNRKQYTVGEINDLARVDRTFSTVMENPTFKRTLTSTTTTMIVECPANSLIVGNFDRIISGV